MTQAAILAASGSPGTTTGFKNRIINGDFKVSQYNGTSSFTTTTNGQYVIDRWNCGLSQSSKFTVQQNAGSVTPPAGYSYYVGLTVISAATVGSGDYFRISQPIEGLNVADLNWGTTNAKTVTLSFWVYSSLTGTYGGSLQNGANNRAYPFQYTISAANTWTQISLTVAGDQTGTWYTNSSTGISVNLGLGVGSTYTAAAGSWASGLYVSANSSTNWVSTNAATFYITGVQLEVGTTATNFDFRSYGTELAFCQRYYYTYANSTYSQIGSGGFYTAGQWEYQVYFPVSMRTTPSATIASGTNYYRIIQTGSQYYFNSLNATNFSLNDCLIYTTTGISATAGLYGRCDVNGGGAISFSAEL